MAGTLVIDTLKSSTANPPTIQNTSGVEVGQLCRAWVNFNGVTTASIRASFNVSSVTRNSTGDYTVNFTNAMADANFASPIGIFGSGAGQTANIVSKTTSSMRLQCWQTGASTVDVSIVDVSAFR